jgi:CDP-diacylglycerol--glycerol-3-phosphate 3-phosphatidyltransferase
MGAVMPRWLPNALSFLRIALVPLWLALALVERTRVLGGEPPRHVALVGLLLIVGATDMLDGFLARRFGLATNLGATLDAVADKLATVTAVTFLSFFAPPGFTAFPVWAWAALLARDVVLGVGFVLVWRRHRTVKVEHRWHGRLSTLLLFVTVVAACAGAPSAAIVIGAAAVVALVVPGTVDYVREGLRQLRAAP